MNDEKRTREMGESGRAYAVENGSWDTTAKRINKFLKKITALSR